MNKKPLLPEKVIVYIAHRGSGKVLWEEELRRRAIEKGKTVLVMRKGDNTDD